MKQSLDFLATGNRKLRCAGYHFSSKLFGNNGCQRLQNRNLPGKSSAVPTEKFMKPKRPSLMPCQRSIHSLRGKTRCFATCHTK